MSLAIIAEKIINIKVVEVNNVLSAFIVVIRLLIQPIVD